ncbi:MAG: hypothetical protein HC925_04565 [Coleofasciculaceae cyanobacterium SM2_3_26]|nr:hypothetical protein [Coleofasciculaceae cyanobacterium SM2_3_26]
MPWLDIDTTTLTVLSQNSSGAIATLLPRLWQELQAAGWVAGTESPTPDRLLAAMDTWLVGMPDLDGDRKPEFLFTLRWDGLQGGGDLGLDVVRAVPLEATQATVSDLALQQRSVLFDDDGTLLYSELTDSSRTIIGAIDPYNGEPPLLLASTSTGYEVLGWSLEQRRLRIVGDRR